MTDPVALPAGFTVVGKAGAIGEAGEGGPVVTVDGAAYDGPPGWSHFG